MSDIFLSLIYSIGSFLYYTLILFVVLCLATFFGNLLFKKFNKKMNWALSAFLSSYIVGFFGVIIIYFIPFIFLDFPLTGLLLADNKFLVFLQLFGLFLLYALVLAVISQLFIFLGSYLIQKFKFKSDVLKYIITLLILSIFLNIVILIFPWSLGGILVMIWL